jgi:glycine cleavage system regulatory protein
MSSKRQTVFIFFIILALSFVVSGCSGSSYSEDMSVQTGQSIADMPELENHFEEVSSDGEEVTMGRKLVYNLDYTLLVPDPNRTVNEIMGQTNKFGGYMVESRLSSDNGESSHARLVVKIPQNNMEQMSAYLETLGTVKHQTMYTDDVTMEYYDTEARLKVLQKEEERMLSFMDDEAATIQDLLAIEREVAQVREKRESLQARMNVLTNQVNYSQFNIGLQTSYNELSTPQGTLSKAKNALVQSLNSMLQLFNWLLIALFAILPYLLLLVLAYLLFRTIKKKRTAKKE